MASKKRTKTSKKSAGPSSRPRIPIWAAVVGPARIVKTPRRTYCILTRRLVPSATLDASNGEPSARPASQQQQQQQGFSAHVETSNVTGANGTDDSVVQAPQETAGAGDDASERHGVVTPPPSPPFPGQPANVAGAMEWTMGVFGSTTRLVGYRTSLRRVSVFNRDSAH